MQGIPSTDRDRLRANLDSVRTRIAQAIARAGRPAGSVRLVAVTKSVGPAVIDSLRELGQIDLGENRPERMKSLIDSLDPGAPDPSWHMIGTYQRRKIRDTLAFFSLVHAVHDLPLLQALHRRAEAAGRRQPALLQVNVSGEASKQGLSAAELPALLDQAAANPNVEIRGLMTMATAGAPEAELRATFGGLRELRDRLRTDDLPLPELSMGMSGDFEIAVEEGATLVRVGSSLFEGLSEATRQGSSGAAKP